MPSEKEIKWLGNSLACLKAFPEKVIKRLGYQLHLIQNGDEPTDWKPVNGIGKGVQGVKEIRTSSSNSWFRVIYVVNIGNKIYILHAFQKSQNQIEKSDLDIIRTRYKQII